MNKEDKTAKREEFQKLILESKESDFEKEHIYIKCPELGKDKRIKICAMTMEDWRLAQAARAHHDCEPWIAYLYYSCKTEGGDRLFESEGEEENEKNANGINFLRSKGFKWFNRYGYEAMKINGLMEGFRAVKK